MLKQSGDTGHKSTIRKVWHYFLILMLALAMIIPAAILPAPVEASPPAPALVSPASGASTNDTTVDLSWSESAGATQYQGQFDNNSDFSSPMFVFGTAYTTYTTLPLADGTYYWRVQAYGTYGGSTGYGPFSSSRSFTVDTVPPSGVPGLVSPANDAYITNDTTPALDWTSVSGAYSYEWQVSLSDYFSSTYSSGITSSSNYTFTSPLSTENYFWRVRARDAAGNAGGWSCGVGLAAWRFTIVAPPDLSSPANGSFISDPTPTFFWNEFSLGDIVYILEVDNNSNFSSPIISYHVSQDGWSTPPLSDGTYYWRVRTIHWVLPTPYTSIDYTSTWSPVWHFTVDTIPPAVPGLYWPPNGVYTTDDTVTLDWNAASGASSYEWQIATNAGFLPVYTSGSTNTIDYATTPPLPYNAVYYWRVRAKDAAGNASAWSAVWHFTVISIPTALTVSPATGYNGVSVILHATLRNYSNNDPIAGKTIDFTLNGTGVGSATTDANGTAFLGVALTGIPVGTYPAGVGASFAGDAPYDPSSATAQLSITPTPTTPPPTAGNPPGGTPPGQPGEAATGGGWYTLEDNSRVNFSFTVNQVPKTSDPIQYKGEVLLINDGKWRLTGNLDSYVYSNSQGRADGSGQLYSWDDVLDRGKGGWEMVDDNASFTIRFTDNGNGKEIPDMFGINISYDVPEGGAALPNSDRIELKGGNIDIKDMKK